MSAPQDSHKVRLGLPPDPGFATLTAANGITGSRDHASSASNSRPAAPGSSGERPRDLQSRVQRAPASSRATARDTVGRSHRRGVAWPERRLSGLSTTGTLGAGLPRGSGALHRSRSFPWTSSHAADPVGPALCLAITTRAAFVLECSTRNLGQRALTSSTRSMGTATGPCPQLRNVGRWGGPHRHPKAALAPTVRRQEAAGCRGAGGPAGERPAL